MARSDRSCLESLKRRPLPLYSEQLDIAVLWNAKAGCTFASRWLYFQEGVLDDASAYSEWPHDYREQVYCRRPGYSDQLERIPTLGPRALKFVRDPFDRAVSSYLAFSERAGAMVGGPPPSVARSMAGLTGRIARQPTGRSPKQIVAEARSIYVRDRQQMSVLRALGRSLGRPVGADAPFSFREFVHALGSVDLDRADPHIRRQIGPCERAGLLPDLTIVQIEQSQEQLRHLEAEMGLHPSNVPELAVSRHNTKRSHDAGFVGDTAFGRTSGIAVPRAQWFYDDDLRSEVARLYVDDFAAYGYDDGHARGRSSNATT